MPRKRPARRRTDTQVPADTGSTMTAVLDEDAEDQSYFDPVDPQLSSDAELEVPEPLNAPRQPVDGGDLLSELADAEDDGEHRVYRRHVRKVRTVVNFRETADTNWKEIIDVETVSRNGAALVLSKPCPIGRIVTLVMDMPRELRAYSVFDDVYPVAGIVQNCTEIMVEENIIYHVGVAFIGKQLPEGHRDDPSRSYRISGVDSNGLWRVVEANGDFAVRRDPRYWISIPITVSYRDERRKVTERTVLTTRDVSRGGMALRGPLELEIGARVKLSSKAHSFFSMAKICNRSDHPTYDAKSLVHFEFEEGNSFPVQMLIGPDNVAEGAEELPDQ